MGEREWETAFGDAGRGPEGPYVTYGTGGA